MSGLYLEDPKTGDRVELLRLTRERVAFLSARVPRRGDRLAAVLVGVASGREVAIAGPGGASEHLDMDDAVGRWPIGTDRATALTDGFLSRLAEMILSEWNGPERRRELLRAAASIERAAGGSAPAPAERAALRGRRAPTNQSRG